MKVVVLTNGMTALVDDEDYDRIAVFRWFSSEPKSGIRYAQSRLEGRYKAIPMHRFILGVENTSEPFVDHKDGNGLNNQKNNLRFATRSQNLANSKKRAGTTSKYKGVSWRSDSRKWRAGIQIDNKMIWLGSFSSEEDAATAYNNAAIKYFGEFARLNMIGG